jgi:hypothetical protein
VLAPQQSLYDTTYDFPSLGFLHVPTQVIGDGWESGGHDHAVPPQHWHINASIEQ